VLAATRVWRGTVALSREAIERVGWHISYETLLTVDAHNPITILQAKGK